MAPNRIAGNLRSSQATRPACGPAMVDQSPTLARYSSIDVASRIDVEKSYAMLDGRARSWRWPRIRARQHRRGARPSASRGAGSTREFGRGASSPWPKGMRLIPKPVSGSSSERRAGGVRGGDAAPRVPRWIGGSDRESVRRSSVQRHGREAASSASGAGLTARHRTQLPRRRPVAVPASFVEAVLRVRAWFPATRLRSRGRRFRRRTAA